MADAIFLPDGPRFIPTELARGPWSPEAQHGGPPAALLARALAREPADGDMLVARLTVELLRPVPIAPLTVATRVERRGRKVQLLGASLHAGDVEVARATALRIRRAALPVPADLPRSPTPPAPAAGVDGQPPWAAALGYAAFHNEGVEHRFVAGSFASAGPATDWIRLRVPLVAGEETPPLARVAAAADFGNGVSWTLSRLDGWGFINPDLTLYLYRVPVGEWICLDAVTHVASEGVGLAESRLFDEVGGIGRALQSLLLER
jgi:hypothetical protein